MQNLRAQISQLPNERLLCSPRHHGRAKQSSTVCASQPRSHRIPDLLQFTSVAALGVALDPGGCAPSSQSCAVGSTGQA
eukprot:COSAG01_NODE_20386_length_956_cov_163.179697_2_plen_78_part_01